MRLPNAHSAVVERGKITEYLLNGAHPHNGGKVAFFRRLGFRGQEWRGSLQPFASWRRRPPSASVWNPGTE